MNQLFSKTTSFLPLNRIQNECPQCKYPFLDRVQRRLVDRALSIFVPVKRYHCESCKWEGNLKNH